MKLSQPRTIVGVAILLIGVLAVDSLSAQTRAPAYMIIEYEVTDQAEFREYLKASAALRATGVGGTFLARAAKGISLSGEPPKTTAILQFESVEDAVAFDRSPEHSALKPSRDKATKWRSFVVEGIGK